MSETRPIIIKKKRRGGHAAHHGGAWKVAYADFVTAMMAFFLLLWLLNAVTEEQLKGIADYFSPISTRQAGGGASGVLTGESVSGRRNFPDALSPPALTHNGPPGTGESEIEPFDEGEEAGVIVRENSDGELDADALDELLRMREEEQFRAAADQLRQALAETPQFKMLADSLVIDNAPEGLRIQIHDQEGLAMFPRGSAEMYLHTRKLLELVAKVILQMPQDVAITGHTDSTNYHHDSGYSNWELSADRANAARRALLGFDVPEQRVSRVVGRAATDPLVADDPTAPANRRLSVVLLRSAIGGSERTSVGPMANSGGNLEWMTEDRAGEDRAGEDRAGEDRAGEDRADDASEPSEAAAAGPITGPGAAPVAGPVEQPLQTTDATATERQTEQALQTFD